MHRIDLLTTPQLNKSMRSRLKKLHRKYKELADIVHDLNDLTYYSHIAGETRPKITKLPFKRLAEETFDLRNLIDMIGTKVERIENLSGSQKDNSNG
jgi:hypothetical protein